MKEQLDKIRAKCVELLAIAEKRTAGEWSVTNGVYDILFDLGQAANAAFIASCAGPAEAGWRATIAAIDFCDKLRQWRDPLASSSVDKQEREILTAWEGLA